MCKPHARPDDAAAARKALPLVHEEGLGPGCQTSSVCFFLSACALRRAGVCPALAANMLCIFVFSMCYRFVLHARAPSGWLAGRFRLAKKLDGLFIMHMSIAWATGRPGASMAAACGIIFGLGDPHALRVAVFGLSVASAIVSLWRCGQRACALAFVGCNLLGVGAFVLHAVQRDHWTLRRLWLWHGGTAMAFAVACVGMELADPASRGYQTRGFLYVG